MIEKSEDKLIARLYYSIDGKKPKKDSWTYIAESISRLKKMYGSITEVAEKLSLSKETIREILKILNLSDKVKTLLNEKKIAYDAAWRLASIKDKKTQEKTANAIIGLSAHDARDIVRFARLHPKEDVSKYANRLIESKGTTQKIKLLIIPINEVIYEKLLRFSTSSKLNVSDFIEKIVLDWIEKTEKKK